MNVLFGLGLETGVDEVPALLAHADRADRDGLDLVTLSDHPYFPDRLDAYAALGVVLGRTATIGGAVSVTNLAVRPAPMLARTVSSLTALAPGRVVLGVGAGGLWDDIVRLGLPRRTPGAAVRAMAEAITLIRALHGGGPPVTMHGVVDLTPSPMPCPPIWTGSGGPASLAVTGRLADGWIPGYAADWHSRRVAESRPRIDEAAAAVGRDPSAITTVYNVVGPITRDPLRVTRSADDGARLGGSVTQWAAELAEAAAGGAGGFIYHPSFTPTDIPVETLIARWTTEVVPAARALISTI
ncbi:LLM class flavin-dependent oxidoreductase [Catenuloplanes sp. NPDC051500]|uniref:LLM class flavin-dependent oxidoreductase n=1 Tax=Catenuloplanes sp. NPDC051500 TaxID=3363959 RepID=UPI0037B870F1